ncbi:hypothetical protein CRE_21026 [Caenorhabditis remanei]|uniref:Uncharacterized protein n=1 Tax=Caenorhabditis remanei TaxID=31234 RepID=E3NMM8_CAERE|nr:hypothetical protein CRE_21026 [Caenorhabditis remanei]
MKTCQSIATLSFSVYYLSYSSSSHTCHLVPYLIGKSYDALFGLYVLTPADIFLHVTPSALLISVGNPTVSSAAGKLLD